MIYGFVKSKSGKLLERFERMVVEVGEPAPAPPAPAPPAPPAPGAAPGGAPPPTEAALAAGAGLGLELGLDLGAHAHAPAVGDAATVVGAAGAADTDLAHDQRAHEPLDRLAETDRTLTHEPLELLGDDAAATADGGGGLFGMLRRRRQPEAAQTMDE